MSSTWKILSLQKKKQALKNPILLVGLPGIGNVGKVASDFITDKSKAVKLYDIFSHSFPHSVFVTEDNLVDLPAISLYAVSRPKGRDLLILAGDVQPTEEEASYDFAENILDLITPLGCKEIITLGGIGLPQVPNDPKVYITGNTKEAVDMYAKGGDVERKLYGVVGPIIGVSGLLLGLSKKRAIPAVCFLAETYGHPMYLGMKGARKLVDILNKRLTLGLDLSQLDKEIEEVEKEIEEGVSGEPKSKKLKKLKDSLQGNPNETNYIG